MGLTYTIHKIEYLQILTLSIQKKTQDRMSFEHVSQHRVFSCQKMPALASPLIIIIFH